MRATPIRRTVHQLVRGATAGAVALAVLAGIIVARREAAAAQAEFAIGDLVVVATDALNYRTGPGLDAAIIDVFSRGKQGAITEGPVARGDYTWYEVGPDGLSTPGWVAGEFLAHA